MRRKGLHIFPLGSLSIANSRWSYGRHSTACGDDQVLMNQDVLAPGFTWLILASNSQRTQLGVDSGARVDARTRT
jgi:hypothetical protein